MRPIESPTGCCACARSDRRCMRANRSRGKLVDHAPADARPLQRQHDVDGAVDEKDEPGRRPRPRPSSPSRRVGPRHARDRRARAAPAHGRVAEHVIDQHLERPRLQQRERRAQQRDGDDRRPSRAGTARRSGAAGGSLPDGAPGVESAGMAHRGAGRDAPLGSRAAARERRSQPRRDFAAGSPSGHRAGIEQHPGHHLVGQRHGRRRVPRRARPSCASDDRPARRPTQLAVRGADQRHERA